MIDTTRCRLIPLTSVELRALVARREQILVEEERAAVQAALEEAAPPLRAKLVQLLGRRP